MGNLQDKLTQKWVKLTGRRFDPKIDEWLVGPIGDIDIINDKFIHTLQRKENLKLEIDPPNAGLLENFNELGFNKNELAILNKKIIRFYENTSKYDFEIWSEWKGFFKPCGRALSFLFSKRLQQLNLPLNSLDASKGIKSEIIKLYQNGSPKWTIWYRKLKSTNDVIYSGIYTSTRNPYFKEPLLKVIFPLPNGNASVVMTRKVLEDGSLLLSSDGTKFGDNGFYFTLTNHHGKFWARYVRSLHEWIRVYVDEDGVMRADHWLKFYGINFLNLHYKMPEKKS